LSSESKGGGDAVGRVGRAPTDPRSEGNRTSRRGGHRKKPGLDTPIVQEPACEQLSGRDYEFENIVTVIAPELAYAVEIERLRTRVGGSDELTPIAIRATTVFRREDGNWKVTHRHGDSITSMRQAESVLQS
jgi:hypothetical protein